MTNETNSSKASRSGSKSRKLPSAVTSGHTSDRFTDSLESVQVPVQRFSGYRSSESSWNVRGALATALMILTISQGCLAQQMPQGQGPTTVILHHLPQNNPVAQPSTNPSMPPFSQFPGALSPQSFGFPPNSFMFNPYGGGVMQPQQPVTHTTTHIHPASGVTHVIHSSYSPSVSASLQPAMDFGLSKGYIADNHFGMGTGASLIADRDLRGAMGFSPSFNPWMQEKRNVTPESSMATGGLPYFNNPQALYYLDPEHPLSPFYKPSKPKCPKCEKCDQCKKCKKCRRSKCSKVYTEEELNEILQAERDRTAATIKALEERLTPKVAVAPNVVGMPTVVEAPKVVEVPKVVEIPKATKNAKLDTDDDDV